MNKQPNCFIKQRGLPDGVEWASGNIFIRRIQASLGQVVEGHTHHFDHTTILFTGSVSVVATAPDGTSHTQTFTAPAHFLILAQSTHEITALADNTEFWCVYSHRDAQGEVVQEYNGWDDPAYH